MLRGKCYCNIGSWNNIERFQFNKRGVVKETQTGQVFTSFPAVTRSTFADIVIGARLVHADAVFAVVLLTRTGLLVQTTHHWLNLTKLASKFGRTFARVLVHAIATRASVLAHVVGTIIHVSGTVLSNKPSKTLARVVGEMVLTRASVLARVNFVRTCTTESNLFLAVSSLKSGHTIALIFSNFINAGPIVLASVI